MFASHFLPANFPIGEEDDITNYIFKEDNAYTEDNVVIYNIFVYSIPIQLTENDVRNYFSKFGKVLDVKLATYKTKSRCETFKKGFVNFAEPESACSVLEDYNHHIQGFLIGVKAGYSWDQPNADKVCGPNRIEYDVASNSKGLHMLSLNDDCIENLLGYLNLKDKVRFARVCERFQDIFQMYYRRQSKNFGLSNISEMTLWEIRNFFRLVGGNIASITGTVPYKNCERIVEFIRESCDKLKRIRLRRTVLRFECLDELLRGYPQLKELTLRNCYLNDNFIKTVTHLNRLETLDLAENVKLTGKFIRNFVQLNELNLFGCYNVQTRHLIGICKSLTNLRSLDVRRCELLSGAFFDAMVEHCKELEILKMTCSLFRYEHVALLPRLKHLELVCFTLWGTIQQRLLAELVAHKVDQLEVLKIVAIRKLSNAHFTLVSELRQLKTLYVAFNPLVNDDVLIKFSKLQQLEDLTIQGYRSITNNKLLKLLKSCPGLRRLDIQFCKKITIEFLLEAISFLKASEKRKQPLVILVYGTPLAGCYDTVYEELKEAAKQHLISVIFDATSVVTGVKDGVDIYDQWYDEHLDSTEDDDEDV